MHCTAHTSSVSVSGHLWRLSLLIQMRLNSVYSRQLDPWKALCVQQDMFYKEDIDMNTWWLNQLKCKLPFECGGKYIQSGSGHLNSKSKIQTLTLTPPTSFAYRAAIASLTRNGRNIVNRWHWSILNSTPQKTNCVLTKKEIKLMM